MIQTMQIMMTIRTLIRKLVTKGVELSHDKNNHAFVMKIFKTLTNKQIVSKTENVKAIYVCSSRKQYMQSTVLWTQRRWRWPPRWKDHNVKRKTTSYKSQNDTTVRPRTKRIRQASKIWQSVHKMKSKQTPYDFDTHENFEGDTALMLKSGERKKVRRGLCGISRPAGEKHKPIKTLKCSTNASLNW